MRTLRWMVPLGLLALGGCGHGQGEQAKNDVSKVARDVGRIGSDSWITTKLKSEYAFDPDVKARQVHVATRDGIVTLTGQVDDGYAARRAVERALRTTGVKEVRSKLDIAGIRTAKIYHPGEAVLE